MDDIRQLTVTTAAASQALTLLSTVKRALDIDSDVETWDSFLIESIARASEAIGAYCSRVFGRETVVETIWLRDSREVINLRRFPDAVIASITEDGTALAEADYLLDAAAGRLRRLSSGSPTCWSACQWIVITYEAGFELLGTLPYPIEDACVRLVKSAYAARGRDPMLKADEVFGLGRQEFWVGSTSGADLPDDVVALIAPYRVIAL